ncbi:hypothetical protein SAMN04488005_1520 [Yoonia tamlensis]|uniref:Uncharacterized protein n=1 Tax=Yoonia tamlensis TaxID=390270 RepID=A0A1I6GEF4_9RHOB|nr:hypothetical protein [Yoonia tamlensis]SFR40566.1 hypothetical protein SAMN04488005_1520 [Yoonia tamlensis]
MMAVQGMRPTAATGARQSIDIWGLIVWAFQREAAQLDLQHVGLGGDWLQGFGYTSMTAIIAEHEKLGCRVDGGGRSDPHPDADLVASALSVLPEGCGGQKMALTIVEHARANTMPDWRVETSIKPRDWFINRHGETAKTADAAALGVTGWPAQQRVNRKGVRVSDAVRYCPVIVQGSAAVVAARRRHWLLFRAALLELRTTFQFANDLTSWVVSDQLPPLRPWFVQ